MEKVVISTSTFGKDDDSSLALLRENNFEVILNPYKRKLKSEELIELAQNASALIAGTEEINEEVMAKLPTLKII